MSIDPVTRLDRTSLHEMMRPCWKTPKGYDLLPSWIDDGTCEDDRMVWVECFIPETKLGTR
jgi:hypothetical protein